MDDFRERLAGAERDTPRGADAVWRAAQSRVRRNRLARHAGLVVTSVALVGLVALVATRHDADAPVQSIPSSTSTAPSTITTTLAPVGQTRSWIATEVAPNSRPAWAHYVDPGTVRSAPPCTLADLDARASLGGAGGTQYLKVQVQNRGARACSVVGAPYLRLLDAQGASLGERTAITAGSPIVLVPTSWVRTDILAITSSVCGTNLAFVDFGLDAAATRRLPVTDGPGVQQPCGTAPLGSSPMARFVPLENPYGDSVLRDLTFAPLRESTVLTAPRSVRRGTTMHFSVIVTNQTLNTFPLDGSPDGNCPLYRMEIVGVTTSPTLLLNCGTAGMLIAQGERARFDMRLAVPADAPLGPASLRWQFVEPAEPALTADVDIVR